MDATTMDAATRRRTRDAVRRVLGGPTPLERWAREMDAAGSTELVTAAAWCGRETLERLIEAVLPVTAFKPDLTLLTNEDEASRKVYMKRWWIERSVARDRTGGEHGLYLHAFWNDDPAGLHNHPWASASLMLAGRVLDHRAGDKFTEVTAGDVMLRPWAYRHRLTMLGVAEGENPRALSLIATGRRRPEGWEIRHADGTRERIPKGNTDGRPKTYSRA